MRALIVALLLTSTTANAAFVKAQLYSGGELVNERGPNRVEMTCPLYLDGFEAKMREETGADVKFDYVRTVNEVHVFKMDLSPTSFGVLYCKETGEAS